MSDRGKVLVSACLLGERVRWDGNDARATHPFFDELAREGRLVSFCPEVAGGLAVPRAPAEIVGGSGGGRDVWRGQARILDDKGVDVSEAYRRGAKATLELAEREGVVMAILKDRSPSCGARQIYDGSFTKKLSIGMGVTAALLGANGIVVFPETEITAASLYWRKFG